MGRYSMSSAYGFACVELKGLGGDCYRLSWTIDRYYATSRLRHPTRYTRDTNEAGARKFCLRHEIDFPDK